MKTTARHAALALAVLATVFGAALGRSLAATRSNTSSPLAVWGAW